MHPRAIAITCDRDYFPGARALLNSIRVYHPELPVYFFERNLEAPQAAWLTQHPLEIIRRPISHLPYFCPGLWEAKQQAPAECLGHARTVCLLDADIVLVSRLDDVFAAAEDGRVVIGCDADHAVFGEEYRVYGPEVVGKSTGAVNSGLLCLDVQRHWDLVGLWAFSSNYRAYSPHHGFPLGLPGFGDQGLLNALIVRLGKEKDCEILPHGVWHDFRLPGTMRIVRREKNGALEVEHSELGERQRILHCVGYKWWWDQPDPHHEGSGDKLACFRHFATLDEPVRKAPETPPIPRKRTAPRA